MAPDAVKYCRREIRAIGPEVKYCGATIRTANALDWCPRCRERLPFWPADDALSTIPTPGAIMRDAYDHAARTDADESAPVAHVGRAIAEAFGMDKLPPGLVVIHDDPSPGMLGGFTLDMGRARTEPAKAVQLAAVTVQPVAPVKATAPTKDQDAAPLAGFTPDAQPDLF